MLNKEYDQFAMMFGGLVSMIMGMVLIIERTTFIENILNLLGYVFLFGGIYAFLEWIFHILRWRALFSFLVELSLSGVCFYLQVIPMALLPRLVSIPVFIYFMSHLMTTYAFISGGVVNWIPEFLLSFIFGVVFVLLFFRPLEHLETLLIYLGLYLIAWGIAGCKGALEEALGYQQKYDLKRRAHIKKPLLLEAWIPTAALRFLHKYLNGDETPEVYNDVKTNEEPDLEVLVHVTERGYSMLGHVDLCYHGKVLSYGNYDASTYRFAGSVGDGVLVVANREDYIPFVIKDSNKTLFGFGIKLNNEQKAAFEQSLTKIFTNTYVWKSTYEKTGDEASLYWYANRLYKETKAKCYKFRKGYFKRYFVMTSNCVALADSVLGKTGIHQISRIGVISPGAYYDYFNNEFKKSNTNVITRTIYH